MGNRWTINDGEPDRSDKYEWHTPNLDQQHVAQTVTPSALNLKPSQISLVPTAAPKQSGIQHGWNNWTFQVDPPSAWYIFGEILQEDDVVEEEEEVATSQIGGIARGTGGGTNTTTTLTPTANFVSSPRSAAVLFVGYSTGGGDQFDSVVDSQGNTWTSQGVHATSGSGFIRVFTSDLSAGALTTSDAIAFSTTATHICSMILFEAFDILGLVAPTFVAGAADGANDPPTITTSSIAVDHCTFAAVFKAWNILVDPTATLTDDTDTTDGPWSASQEHTTNGTFGSKLTVLGQYKTQAGAASTQTYNPTSVAAFAGYAEAWVEFSP